MNFLKTLTFTFLVAANVAYAADPTHHFKLSKPELIKAGEKAKLVFEAVREDGTIIPDAKHNLKLFVANSTRTDEYKVTLRKGTGSIDLTFEKPGLFLLQVEDIKNSNLTLSDSLKVDLAVSRDMDKEVRP